METDLALLLAVQCMFSRCHAKNMLQLKEVQGDIIGESLNFAFSETMAAFCKIIHYLWSNCAITFAMNVASDVIFSL